jgi:hypothetical protein
MKLDSGQTILNWEKFEKRQKAEINSKGNKGRRGYAWEMAKYRLAKGQKVMRAGAEGVEPGKPLAT